MKYLIRGTWLQTHAMLRAPIAILVSVLIPVLRAIVLVALFTVGLRTGDMAFAVIGAGLAAIWASVLFGAANLIQNERWQGTFDLMICSARPLPVLLMPVVCATAVVGVFGMAATLIIGGLVAPGGIPIPSIPALVSATLLFIFSLIGMALIIGAIFVVMPNGNALANALEYPIWILSGFVLPISALPPALQAVGQALPSTVSTRLVHEAVKTGALSLPDVLVSVTLSIGAGVLGFALVGLTERSAIRAGTVGVVA